MGRPRTIDRDKLLDAAEAVVSEVGAAGLSIDAVAKAAGVTKSGVQHCFGTKQQLIDAMFDRWEAEFDEEVAEAVGDSLDPIAQIRAEIEVTMRTDEVDTARSAVLMAAIVQTPEQRRRAQKWYRRRIEQMDGSAERGRRARLAFLAAEGAFLLRSFGLYDVSDAEWTSIFTDILALQSGRLGTGD